MGIGTIFYNFARGTYLWNDEITLYFEDPSRDGVWNINFDCPYEARLDSPFIRVFTFPNQ